MIRSLITAMLLTLTSFSTMSAQVNIQDSLALLVLYEATNGEQWKNNTNWLSGPVSTWHGITLQGDRVYIINLFDNGLDGYIPNDIGQLKGLVELQMSRNNFTGGIPNVFGDMPDFYQLSLRDCGLTGEIPSSLGSCPKFGRLNLNGNQLTGTIPPALAACTDLIHLLLRGNNLSGPFPPVIETFEHLTQLELSGNDFTGSIPEWIASLDDLWWLFLEDISFSGPMPFLGDKPNLEQLYISNNSVTGHFEDVLGSYPNLKYCIITNTRITGHLSPTHFNPENIIRLEVTNNEIESMGNFTTWQNQPGFQRLVVGSNRLDFDDLLSNSGLPSNKFFYSPQKPIGADTVVALFIGEEYAIYSPMQDQDILYQWYFNNMVIEGVENYDLLLPPFTPELAGNFYFIATHPALPNLTMQSAITTLVEETTSTAVAENSVLHIYPNPTQDDVVLLSAPETLPYQISLYSAEGRLLQTRTIQDHQSNLSLQDYPPGIFLLQSTTSTGNTLNRIIKQ